MHPQGEFFEGLVDQLYLAFVITPTGLSETICKAETSVAVVNIWLDQIT